MLRLFDDIIREHMSAVAENAEEDNATSNPYNLRLVKPSYEKYRTVFDTSSSRIPGSLLSENLETGANLNQGIVSILMNFRRHRAAL